MSSALAHTSNREAQLAIEIMRLIIQPHIDRMRPNNIPAINVGPELPQETWQAIYAACLQQNYEATCAAIGTSTIAKGSQVKRYVIALTYVPKGADGDR